ncbi:MAG: hypothetical protein AABX55_00245 [Nanoarchaeota archaeon]
MAKQEEKKYLLSDFSVNLPYQSDLEWHSENMVLGALQKLSQLDPNTKEYWQLKSNLCYCIASNAIEQFARDKYDAGMLTRTHFIEIFRRLENLEEKVGEETCRF